MRQITKNSLRRSVLKMLVIYFPSFTLCTKRAETLEESRNE